MSADPIERARAFFADDGRPRHGKYELVRELGRGGMAVVWEAIDPDLKRRVALKIMKGGSFERLRREAEAAARLRHPNVVAVHDVGPDYIAMDLVDGATFAEAGGAMSVERRLQVLEQAAEAVAHAHAEGVVHRDLKPHNLLVGKDGRVLLSDFGLARIEGSEALTREGAVIGTPHWMAPEQVRGEAANIGPATDVWALGVLLYEAVSGVKPFDGASPHAIHDAIIRRDPAPLSGPAGAIAAKALEKDPARRYRDAGGFLADLRRLGSGEAVDARRSSASRWLRRNGVVLALFAASAFILAGGIVLGRWVTDERRKAVEALREQARISLDAALELRRAGANERMRQFLPAMEGAYRQAVQRAPDLPEVHWLMGRMYRALLERGKALDLQRLAYGQEGGFPPAAYEIAVLHAADLGQKLKATLDGATGATRETSDEALFAKRAEALAHAESFLAQGGEGPERSVAQALVMFLGKEDAQASRKLLEGVLSLDPLHEDARIILAWIVQSVLLPDVEARERSWKKAEELYTRGLERDKGFIPDWLARGQLRWSRGSARRHRGLDPSPDYDAAESDYTQALRLNPEGSDAAIWRGQSRVYQGIWAMEQGRNPLERFDAADRDFQDVQNREPDSYKAAFWRGNGWFYRGVWLASQGLYPLSAFNDSEFRLDQAAKSPDANRVELRWRGRMLAQKGAALARRGEDPSAILSRAEKDFQDSAVKDPWHWTWWSTVFTERARWKMSRGVDPGDDLARAEGLLSEVLTLSPNFGEGLRHRAMVRLLEAEAKEKEGERVWAAGAYARAAADFEAALAVNPNFRHQVGDLDVRARKKADELR